MSSVSGLDTAFHLGILGVVGASVTIGAVNDWSGVVIALVMLPLLVIPLKPNVASGVANAIEFAWHSRRLADTDPPSDNTH
ncbi:hypothetical protein [Rhodococcus sp. (in: high G+C Gram-positive bacteria)]|uniref:hypothetical protein n=1 Tax=Rhodococcus sp. TaxID=1831 RepID=UPI00257F3915|nr:hypothetical protein [Rhodococcus sp. (in: high G+C Gram-positive bacteria)]MBQ9053028.1 hypothetical protein [Rhodococcus sp. (in: high G+C Gram-positive bacteria)]